MEPMMNAYSDQKKPAFFRIMSPELFFEAEAMNTESVLDALNNSVALDAELDALLNETDGQGNPVQAVFSAKVSADHSAS
jgi:hypothetical protein